MRSKRAYSLPEIIRATITKRARLLLTLVLALSCLGGAMVVRHAGATELGITALRSLETSTATTVAHLFGGSISTSIDESTDIPLDTTTSTSATTPMFACVAPPSGLNAWYQGENNANDIQNGSTGTLENGVAFAAGNVGQAFNFDGTNDSVLIPSQNLGNSYTVEFWIKPNGTPSGLSHLVSNNWQSANYGALYIGPTFFLQYWQGSSPRATTASNIVSAGLWSHVALTRDNTDGKTRIYVNGTLAATSSSSFAAPFSNQVRLGNTIVSSDTLFRGMLDEVSFYNTALSQPDIASIFGSVIDGKCVPTGLRLLPVTTTVNRNAPIAFTTSGEAPPLSFSIPTNNSGATIDPGTGAYVSGPSLGVDTVRVTDATLATADSIVTVAVLCNPGEKTWDGGGVTNNWSEAANWSCDQVPLTTDNVIFDGASSKNVTINTNVTVANFSINSGYAGTISQGSSSFTVNSQFTQNAGTFVGGNAPMTIEIYSLAAGSFTSTSSTLAVRQNFTVNNGATFIHNNGTLDGGFSFNFLGTASSLDLNNFKISAITNLTSRTFNVAGTLNFTGVGRFASGTINAFGNVTGVIGGASAGTLKIVGTATRTIDISATSVTQNVVVNAPNVTISASGAGTTIWGTLEIQNAALVTNATAEWRFGSFTMSTPTATFTQGTGPMFFVGPFLQNDGTYNASSGAISSSSSFTVAGGNFVGSNGLMTFNFQVNQTGGTFSGGSATIIYNNQFIVSGGIYNASSGTTTIGNNLFQIVNNAAFHANSGTVRFSTTTNFSSGDNNSTFNHVVVDGTASLQAVNMNVNGNLTINGSMVNSGNGGTALVKGNVTVGSTATGGTANLTFNGTGNQTFVNNGGINLGGTWIVNSGSTVTATTPIILPAGTDLSINSGTLYLNSGSDLSVRNLTVSVNGRLVNDSATTLTLGGSVSNSGKIDLQGSGAPCPEADTVLIRSSVNGSQRSWTGAGAFRLVDVDVKDMGGSGTKSVFSGTNSGGNNGTWIFNSGCPDALSISPLTVDKFVGQTQVFTGGGGFTPYTFSVATNNSGGNITSGGNYTAGTTPNVTDSVRVTDAFGSSADATVNVYAGPPAKLGYTLQPSNATAGSSISPSIKVAVQDASGNTVGNATDAVTIAILNNTGGGTLSGTLTRNAVGGVATFDDLSINKTGTGYTLRVTSGSLTAANSTGFDITPGAPHHLTYTVQPSNVNINTAISPAIQVAVRDQFDNQATQATDAVTLAIGTDPTCPSSCATLGGTSTRNAVGGVATFDDITLDRAANGFTLNAASGSLTDAASNAFNVIGPTQLAFSVQPTNTAPDATITPTVKVEVRDQNGSLVTNATDQIHIAIGNNPGGGTLNGNQITNAINGVATFAPLSISGPGNFGNGYTLVATSGTLTQATSNAFNILNPFVVTNTNDSGAGSLRSIVTLANATPGTQTISFNIVGSAPFTIQLQSDLPDISDVVIDGTTQPGFAGSPVVEVTKPLLSSVQHAFALLGNTTVKGLVMNKFPFNVSLRGDGNTLQGNYIGTNLAGTAAGATGFTQRYGVICSGVFNQTIANTMIGGANSADRNVISGNSDAGIGITCGGSGNSILGNYIGTNAAGTAAIPNGSGIVISKDSSWTVGDTGAGEGNLISSNTGRGININDDNTHAVVRGNSITSNGSFGIDLRADSISLNDPADPDAGPNAMQNYPDIDRAFPNGGGTDVEGTLSSSPSQTFAVDFYSNPTCHSSGWGEGKIYLGTSNVTTDAAGIASYTKHFASVVANGEFITATATDASGNTSEFSRCRVVAPIRGISGQITENGDPLANVLVSISGTVNKSVLTESDGKYLFDDLPDGGNYTVTPTRANYNFAPPTRVYTNLTVNQGNQDFVGTQSRFRVRGEIRNSRSFGAGDVTVTLSGDASATAVSHAGFFVFNGLVAGNYTLTPSKPGFTFTPPSINLNVTGDDFTSQFTSHLDPPLTGRIMYKSGTGERVMEADSSGETSLPILASSIFDAEFSRDGSKIVFMTRRCVPSGSCPARQKIVVSDYDGANLVVKLTAASIDEQFTEPTFSPDGTKIAFIHTSTVVSDNSIRILNLANNSQSVVLALGRSSVASSLSWSPDGQKLAFAQKSSGTKSDVFTINTDGTAKTQLTTSGLAIGFNIKPVWSPNGTKIAYIAKNRPNDNGGQLFIMNPDGTSKTTIAGPFIYTSLVWSPDNTWLGYNRVADATNTAGFGIVNLDGTFNRQYTTALTDPTWAPAFAVNTPAGIPGVSSGGTTITFGGVSTSGSTTVTPIAPSSAGTNPNGFSIGQFGAFEISTTAAITPPIKVCFSILFEDFTPNAASRFNQLRVLHNEGGVLIDRTTSHTYTSPSTLSEICATTTSLSPFAIGEVPNPALPSITGLLMDDAGNPMVDATVDLGGTETRSTTTDINGLFSFANLSAGGNYVIEPHSPGYLFTDPDATMANVSGENTVVFTGTAATVGISGRVTDEAGDGVADVQLSLDGSSIVVTSDANGDYAFTNLPADTDQIVTAFDGTHSFSPPAVALNRLTGNASGVDFTAAIACGFTLTPSSENFAKAGGTGSFDIAASDVGCTWTAVSNDAWITVTSGPSGTGSGTIGYSVAANTGNPRTGTITAGGETFNVTQDGDCVTVSIPSSGITGARGSEISVPVSVTSMTGRNALAFDFTINYDPATLTPTSPSNSGTMSSGFVITTNVTTPGTLVVSGFGSSPLVGSGTLLNLRFNVVGNPPACSPVTFASFEFNEGTPCVTTTNGQACAVNGTISGTANYSVSAVPLGVPGVAVNSTGATILGTVTDAGGHYSLTGFNNGAHTILPSKNDDINGITSFDAALISQHVVNLITLSPAQQIAADVSGKGTISSFDAALIAQWKVGIISPVNQTGQWRFTPPSTSPDVSMNIFQDYGAILMGEVSGNWLPSFGPVPDPVAQVTEPVEVSLPTATAGTASIVKIPVITSDLSGRGVISYEFDLNYDPSVIEPVSIPFSTGGTLSSAMSVTVNATSPGSLRVAAFGPAQLSSAGHLLDLKFSVVGQNGSVTPLTINNFLYNEGNPQSVTSNGQLHVLAPTAANVSVGGRVTLIDGRGVSKARLTLTDASGNVRTTLSSHFGYYRFDNVPAGGTYVLSIANRRFVFVPDSRIITLLDEALDIDFVGTVP